LLKNKSTFNMNPIEVQVWPDRIEVLSFPGPVPPVDAPTLTENKRIVARDYRNRRVGDFLKELHLTEGRGTGIPTMRKAMVANGSSQPTLETNEQCTYFLTVLPVHPEWLEEQERKPGKYRASGDQVVTKSGPDTDDVKEKDRTSTEQVPGKFKKVTGEVPGKYRGSFE
jgi:ATP-dependent DNA helicase RecG